ncbi:tRNA uracil 4-sulfurtransferase ThiI [Tindallia californiensis]|uniref:Probable tRNA sulfurtransferase n=1 Tax=Tindallia californiensis TaxID=159292 RepID=A0A1H3N9V7_9FIRM|nr:tRNA uracil 4-sulfurtransferase ThiI [Tindallia californiensis]SDY85544.1 thiamine biosynthesis protein ThiI [Tindallia californiensis]
MVRKEIIIRSGETVLKGKNRKFFEDKLLSDLHRVLKPMGILKMFKKHNRVYIPVNHDNHQKMIERLKHVFGVDLISIASVVEKDIEVIKSAALQEMKEVKALKKIKTFKVESKRTDKNYPIGSLELSRLVGGFLLHSFDDLEVDVHHPDVTIYVEVKEEAYIFTDREKGIGGLPKGSNGQAMLLLSGGIDSPVAGWMVAKRGVLLKAVHFHSYPYTSERAYDKVVELAERMSAYCGSIQLFSVNLLPFQQAIADTCPESEGTILVRRMMTRIAEKLADENKCDALITGESLGQVASQTIQSIRVTTEVATLPILRPLIAMDKQDIIEVAKMIKTYKTSILPYEDCCTVFLPQKPVTKPRVDKIKKSEEMLDIEKLTEELYNSMEMQWIKSESKEDLLWET